MRVKIASALGALAAVAMVAGTVGAAGASAAEGAPVRAVHLPNCGGDYFMPCKKAPWYLYLRDGRWVKFPDAARYATEADGARADEVEDDPAPFEVSGDGGTIAYVRARDNRVVVERWPGGKATVLPSYGKGVGTKYVDLFLSPDGRRLLVGFAEAAKKRAALVVDAATGETVRTLPVSDVPKGFGADGDEVLATRAKDDNTIEVLAYPLDGEPVADTPPQEVVSRNSELALAADGHTLLVRLPTAGKQPERVRTYDLRARAWAGKAKPVKAKQGTSSLAWGPGGRLELRRDEGSDEEGQWTTWVYALDAATGATKLVDKYTIRAGVPK
ncbi:YncE family protein [Nonomuraea sp. NPDC050451]|uniref:YncE family protein n=1 Tax=Nonomuraea sp. NPDC050451 TaxID=3364364 RepID=UPI0037B80D9D